MKTLDYKYDRTTNTYWLKKFNIYKMYENHICPICRDSMDSYAIHKTFDAEGDVVGNYSFIHCELCDFGGVLLYSYEDNKATFTQYSNLDVALMKELAKLMETYWGLKVNPSFNQVTIR